MPAATETTCLFTTSITADIVRYLFHDADNDYSALKLREHGKTTSITAVGYIPADIPVGTSVSFTGAWVTDKKWGEQYKFELYHIEVPDSVQGLKKYLCSGLIPGIGPATAEKIVNYFGLAALDIIRQEPQRLSEIPRLSTKKIAKIRDAVQAHADIEDIMIYLQSVGISSSYAGRIYKKLGKDTIATVKYNPYALTDIHGIGFLTADNIAKSVGIPLESETRIKCGVLYALSLAAGDGHCYLPLEELVIMDKELSKVKTKYSAALLLKIDPGTISRVYSALVQEGKLVIEDDRAYLPHIRKAEVDIATRVNEMLVTPPLLPDFDLINALPWAENTLGIKFAGEQREAIRKALDSKLSVITGGPGTGKSTLLKGLVLLLKSKKVKFVLAAPTGRAARRMEELTGEPATTIHRLLEYNPSLQDYSKNTGHFIDADVVILDETSMLELMLCNQVFKATPQSSSIIFIGDVDQLPSIGSGQILKDIIGSNKIPVTYLTQIFRQNEGSLISLNAQLINQGKKLNLMQEYTGLKDFYFIEKDDPKDVHHEIVTLVSERLPKKLGFSPAHDIMVLCPVHKGKLGTIELNNVLQNTLNPSGQEVKKGSRIYRQGDRVIQTKNCYDKQVFNGDIGIIADIDTEENIVVVNFDGHIVNYDYENDLDELSLAYSISIHKAQGSEYPCVILPIDWSHYVMLARDLLYTGVSRGRKMVIIIGSKRAVSVCIKNNDSKQRFTTLKKRIIKSIEHASLTDSE